MRTYMTDSLGVLPTSDHKAAYANPHVGVTPDGALLVRVTGTSGGVSTLSVATPHEVIENSEAAAKAMPNVLVRRAIIRAGVGNTEDIQHGPDPAIMSERLFPGSAFVLECEPGTTAFYLSNFYWKGISGALGQTLQITYWT